MATNDDWLPQRPPKVSRENGIAQNLGKNPLPFPTIVLNKQSP